MILSSIKKKLILPGLSVLLIALAFLSYYKDNSHPLWDQYILGESKEMPSADQPEMAALMDFNMTVDPALGRVPTERLYKAYVETKALKQESRRSTKLEQGLLPC